LSFGVDQDVQVETTDKVATELRHAIITKGQLRLSYKNMDGLRGHQYVGWPQNFDY